MNIFCAALLFGCWSITAASQVTSRPLTTAELTTAKSKLVPAAIPEYKGNLQIETKQAFGLTGTSSTIMWLLPVTYQAKFEEGTAQRCGLFTLAPSGQTSFVETFGPDLYWPWECYGVQALGFTQSGMGTPPRVLVKYEGAALIAAGDTQTAKGVFVFDWDGAAGRYALNEAIEDRLRKEKRPTKTIPEAKRVIQSYDVGVKAP